jgi:hypothetical protein
VNEDRGESRPRRRANDDQMAEVFKLLEQMKKQQHEFQVETRGARINSLSATNCLRDSFVAFADADKAWKGRFEPYLVARVAEEKDEADFIKERRKAWKVKVYDGVFYGLLACIGFVLIKWGEAKTYIMAALK